MEKDAMPFKHRTFGVEIVRQIDSARLSWPEPGEAMDDRNPGGNRRYIDLRNLSWAVARRVIEMEQGCISRIETAQDPGEIGSTIAEAMEDQLEWEDLLEEVGPVAALDVGVASTTAALSAAGCIPITSCNAGAYGGWHYEEHPLVVFYARPEAAPLLMECAETARVGLEIDDELHHTLIVYADDIRKMCDFAKALSQRSVEFRHVLSKRGPKGSGRSIDHYSDAGQMRLSLDL